MDVTAVINACTLTEARYLLDHFLSMGINKVRFNSSIPESLSRLIWYFMALSGDPPLGRRNKILNGKKIVFRA